jgi:hypothetical protein
MIITGNGFIDGFLLGLMWFLACYSGRFLGYIIDKSISLFSRPPQPNPSDRKSNSSNPKA